MSASSELYESITLDIDTAMEAFFDLKPEADTMRVEWDNGTVYIHAIDGGANCFAYALPGDEAPRCFSDLMAMPQNHREWFVENAAIH